MSIFGWHSKKGKKGKTASTPQPLQNRKIGGDRTGGDIVRYGLEGWWLSEFSAVERNKIADAYRPLGTSGRPLIEGKAFRQTDLHPSPFLANLAEWVAKPGYGDLALRIADKAATFNALPSDLSQSHFMFNSLCKVYYRFRDTHPGALEKAVWACEQDIALSSKLNPRSMGGGVAVSHYCYKQLAIIEEKRKNYDRAIKLCRIAMGQGWNGDWEKRISRLEKKLQKSS